MTERDFGKLETLLVERNGTALFVTLNRPESRNALSATMWKEIDVVFAAMRDDRSVRAIVLRGAGGNFSAGGVLKERDTIRDALGSHEAMKQRNSVGGEILLRIDQSPQVVVAVVEGNTLGGGFGLACVADIVIAHESAVFRMPELGLGIPPAQIAPYVVRRTGLAKARRLALTTATIGGREAVALGIADFFCETRGEMEERIASVLADIDRCGPEAIAPTKALMSMAERGPSEAYIDYASGVFATAYLGAEGQEGAAAIRERRRPRWQEQRR
jgi:isohexenylglutaconyl-CoA hydratase